MSMECPRNTTCAIACDLYANLCTVTKFADHSAEAAMQDMAPDAVAEITDGRELSADQREQRDIAFAIIAEKLPEARARKARLEQDLIAQLPMLRKEACPTCPVTALGEMLARKQIESS